MGFYLFRKMIRRLPGIVIKAVPLPEPVITEGFGTRLQAGRICKERGYHSVLLVTDKVLYSLGFQESVIKSLEENGVSYKLFYNIDGEPTVGMVSEGRSAAEECRADCIIALGGGAVMDTSKVIAASARNYRRRIGAYLTKFVLAKTLPMINIPTTAGTGAEMTVGAVIKNAKGVKSSSVIVGLKVPDVILDSELTVNAPSKVTLSCGIDALSHGFEGCVADVKTRDEDMKKSMECVRLVLENLPALVDDPHNIDRRQKLCLAANYGGNAINKQLAGYVHAFAHTIGAVYHISHGEAIARCLLPVAKFQENLCSEKLQALAVYCGCENAAGLFDKLEELIALSGFAGGFSKIEEKDYPELIRLIDADSINYSPPKTFTDKEIVLILNRIKNGEK
ncbi:MAG: iron-containing alcohol dehydrogenase [Lachnospiraceae bacterium]|nr:iron-containing alcohol dehydrogenase [Lachnospiraceae bacterium]